MKLFSLASGSTGNCVYVGDGKTNILIDIGITAKALKIGLGEIGLDISDITALLITHEHNDHIGGIGVFNRKHPCKIYSKKATLDAIKKEDRYGKIDYSCFESIEEGEKFFINDFEIKAIKTYHDAVDPSCYILKKSGKKAVMLTDTGKFTEKMVDEIKGVNALYVESNHDVKMVEMSDYPYGLKMRILGDLGHLSNEMTAEFISKVYTPDMHGVVLGHLSRHNNMPDLAKQVVCADVYTKLGIDEKTLPIYVAKIKENSEIIEF